MAWIPYEKYIVLSELTAAEIKEKFDIASQNPFKGSHNYSQAFFTNPKNTDVFKGVFVKDHFEVEADIPFKLGGRGNAFRPQARVRLIETVNGTLCTITLQPNKGVVLFLMVAITFVLIGCLVKFINDLSNGAVGNELSFAIGSILFIYVMCTIGFNSELPELEDFIKRLLEVK